MIYRALAVCVLGVALLSCSSDAGGGGISSLFEALNGEYTLRSGTDCVIEVLGSRVRTLNSAGNQLCKLDDIDGDGESLKVDATLSDDRMSGTFDYNERYDYDEIEIDGYTKPGCHLWNEKRVEMTLEATKTRGREREGRFAGLAGVWTGTLTVKQTNFRNSSCAAPFDMEFVNERYELQADISGAAATIAYQLKSGTSTEPFVDPFPNEYYTPVLDTSGQIQVTEDAAGQLRIDGNRVEVR